METGMRLNASAGLLSRLMENKGWSVVITIFATLLIFGALIFIHELGHYLTARLFHVKIREFAIGMGPKVVSHTSKKTGILYSYRAFPIGGYVAMEGEDEESKDPDSFSNKKVWQRMIITVAGAAMNLLLGFLLTLIFVSMMPVHVGTTVMQFSENSVSDKCEQPLMLYDEILRVNGNSVKIGQDAAYEIRRAGSDKRRQVRNEEGKVVSAKVDFTVRREGKTVELHDVAVPVESAQGYVFGDQDFLYNAVKKTFPSVMKNTVRQMRLTVKMIYESLFDLITGRYGFDAVSGPVGTGEVVGEAIRQDAAAPRGQSPGSVLYLILFITINLGIFNLLPIPALDGGRLLFQFIELIFRKPIPKKYEAIVNTVGIILLLGLMVAVTFKDIVGLFRR